MYSFKNDYSEGAHIKILEELIKTNMKQEEGYGKDIYSNKAKFLIKEQLKNEEVDIHFLSGGTQTNLTAISSFLRPYEACISAYTGHIAVHETGAIESCGHKVITVKTKDGKLRIEDIKNVCDYHSDEHMVKPKLVYISNSTELGTIYRKNELKILYNFCKENNLILYLDGARIGAAVCSDESGFELSDICKFTDAFYIGGTKNGTLLGEALIIKKDNLKNYFRYSLKQKGGLMAKGRTIGIQFKVLFEDGLFYELAKHSNKMAQNLKKNLIDLGCTLYIDTPTNQIFPIIKNSVIEGLRNNFDFYIWEEIDENYSALRLVTSWATPEKEILKFIEEIKRI
jgi:threonine aldolase